MSFKQIFPNLIKIGYMSSIQPWGFLCCDEKLRSIGIFSCVGHRQPPNSVMLQLEVLIWESLSVDTATTGAISISEITPLKHEVFDDSMEQGTLVPLTSGFLGKFYKVFDRLWNCLSKQTYFDSTCRFTSNFDIEPYLRQTKNVDSE